VVDFHHPFPLGDLAMLFYSPEKLVVHYHSDIVRQKILSFFFKPLIMNTLKKADKIVVSNPYLIKTSPYLKRFKEKCEVTPFGVDLDKFKDCSNQDKVDELKEEYGDFVMFAGRLGYYKGLQYLIRAIKNIDTNLVLIGEGDQDKKLKRLVAKLGLEDKVKFLPFQTKENLINFYQAAQVFVLPSIFRSEAFGIVLIEAMSQGTPLISTELGTGTSWVNQDGETGFVVSPKNKKELARAIKKILDDKDLKEQFSKNARQRVEEKFTLSKMLNDTYQLYKSLV